MEPTATREPSADNDTESAERSSAASPSISAPTCDHVSPPACAVLVDALSASTNASTTDPNAQHAAALRAATPSPEPDTNRKRNLTTIILNTKPGIGATSKQALDDAASSCTRVLPVSVTCRRSDLSQASPFACIDAISLEPPPPCKTRP